MVRVHIKPKWENTRLADIRALDVKGWLDKDFKGGGAASKKRAKGVISRMLDLAMLWKLTPIIERNPMQLVKVKGSTKQQKPLIILTMEQFIALVRELRQRRPLQPLHELILSEFLLRSYKGSQSRNKRASEVVEAVS